jgi:hypothetical protein
MSTTGEAGFTGWYRPDRRHPWRPVCAAGSEQRCWLDLLRACRGSGLLVVLAAGQTPDDLPAGAKVWERKPGWHLLPLQTTAQGLRARVDSARIRP